MALSTAQRAPGFEEHWDALIKGGDFAPSLARAASPELAEALAEAALRGAAPPAALHTALRYAADIFLLLGGRSLGALDAVGAMFGERSEGRPARVLRSLALGVSALRLEEAGEGQLCGLPSCARGKQSALAAACGCGLPAAPRFTTAASRCGPGLWVPTACPAPQ